MDTNHTDNKPISLEFIESILAKLAEKRPLFWSEADFQFAFAWAIKEELGNSVKIELERRFVFPERESDKYYVDIWVEYDGKVYPIELKYKTRKCDSCGVNTISQSANDLGRYFYLWDIHRLDELKKAVPNFAEGYAIMLTNDSNYYDKPASSRSQTAVDHCFRIHERPSEDALFPITSEIKWDVSRIADKKNGEDWTKKYPGFTLNNPFTVNWKSYKKLDDCDIELKYLINAVN